MPVKYINTQNAPAAVGPYSQAVKTKDFLFVSGQLPLDPKTGEICGADAAAQAERCLENILAILASENIVAAKIVKTTIYLKNMSDFSAVNEVYAGYFKKNYPARACIEVARLPKEALVEIEAIAIT